MNYLEFITGDYEVEDKQSLVVDIPPQINSKKALLNVYFEQMNFPSYFGFNWDALSDMLTDLNWINNSQIIIKHSGLPNLDKADLITYIEILNDSFRSWKERPIHDLISLQNHSLKILFPIENREIIEQILTNE